MKKRLFWKILFLIGLCPFLAPFIYFIAMNIVHNHYDWTLTDMLFIWSYLYWPTYIVGFVLSSVSINKLKNKL